jgi:hypothetical protein
MRKDCTLSPAGMPTSACAGAASGRPGVSAAGRRQPPALLLAAGSCRTATCVSSWSACTPRMKLLGPLCLTFSLVRRSSKEDALPPCQTAHLCCSLQRQRPRRHRVARRQARTVARWLGSMLRAAIPGRRSRGRGAGRAAVAWRRRRRGRSPQHGVGGCLPAPWARLRLCCRRASLKSSGPGWAPAGWLLVVRTRSLGAACDSIAWSSNAWPHSQWSLLHCFRALAGTRSRALWPRASCKQYLLPASAREGCCALPWRAAAVGWPLWHDWQARLCASIVTAALSWDGSRLRGLLAQLDGRRRRCCRSLLPHERMQPCHGCLHPAADLLDAGQPRSHTVHGVFAGAHARNLVEQLCGSGRRPTSHALQALKAAGGGTGLHRGGCRVLGAHARVLGRQRRLAFSCKLHGWRRGDVHGCRTLW